MYRVIEYENSTQLDNSSNDFDQVAYRRSTYVVTPEGLDFKQVAWQEGILQRASLFIRYTNWTIITPASVYLARRDGISFNRREKLRKSKADV